MKRYEILPVKQKDSKVEGYFIFDNLLKSRWTDHSGEVYFTKSKSVAVEIANALNTQ